MHACSNLMKLSPDEFNQKEREECIKKTKEIKELYTPAEKSVTPDTKEL